MQNCPTCGRTIYQDEKYCLGCGLKLKIAQTKKEAEPEPTLGAVPSRDFPSKTKAKKVWIYVLLAAIIAAVVLSSFLLAGIYTRQADENKIYENEKNGENNEGQKERLQLSDYEIDASSGLVVSDGEFTVKDKFPEDIDKLSLQIETAGDLPAGTKLEVRWYNPDGKMIESEVKRINADDKYLFNLRRGKQYFLIGEYKAELYINEEWENTVNFFVIGDKL